MKYIVGFGLFIFSMIITAGNFIFGFILFVILESLYLAARDWARGG